MKPTPPGWPRISQGIFYDDAPAAIDFVCKAFGFEVRIRVDGDDGEIVHSELVYGDDGLIMIGSSKANPHGEKLPMVSPQQTGGLVTQAMAIFVDDADAHCAHARANGAIIADEPNTQDHGPDYWADRTYRAIDPEGHQWWFMQRVRGPGA